MRMMLRATGAALLLMGLGWLAYGCGRPDGPGVYVTRPWACDGFLQPGTENAVLYCGGYLGGTLGAIVPRERVEQEGARQ